MAGGSIADTRIDIRLQPLLVAKHCSGVAQLRALRRFFVPANLRTRIGVSWHIGLRARIALGRHLELASSNNSRFVTVQLGSPSTTALSRAPVASAFDLAFFVAPFLWDKLPASATLFRASRDERPPSCTLWLRYGFSRDLVAIIFAPMSAFFPLSGRPEQYEHTRNVRV